ncbi:MAG: zinc ribbon domain-containing protein [Planctomycetes bacterium]|nr:zinc ribbon domain-containing protein [Planctomycetota bacterium]
MANQCPKCKAELPRRGRFCVDCGLDLYAEGLRHRPIPWFPIIALPVVVAGVLAVLIIGPCKGETAPEVDAVVGQSREFLRLLADKDYARVVDRFLKANSARYAEVEEKLRQCMRGAGAQGLKNAQSHGFRNLDEVFVYVKKHSSRSPEYVAHLLHAIVSHAEPNPWLSPRRAEVFYEWYLAQAFGGADLGKAQLAATDARWEEGMMTVKVRFPEPPKVLPGVADPSVLRWRLVSGGWGGCERQRAVLDFAPDDRLNDLLDLLKRLTAE